MAPLKKLAQKEPNRFLITAIKVFQLKGHGIQSIIKVETDQGVWGIGEAGLPAKMVQGYLDFMSDSLLGQDALQIEKNYAYMIRMRAQWHAHWAQNPVISGIDMALWDIAGKVFNRPICELLTGRFRDEIEMYINTSGPKDWRDKGACREWADRMKGHPNGIRTFKIDMGGLLGTAIPSDAYQGGYLSKTMKPSVLRNLGRGYENLREALGWDYDIIIHCHNEFDFPSALGIAKVVEPVKPLWMEDPMPVIYSDTWKALRDSSPVPIITGEKLEHPAEFLQFMSNGAVHAIHPDIAFVGGLTGGRKIADLAELFYIPVGVHQCGSYVQLVGTAHWGATVRNFTICEVRDPATDKCLYTEMCRQGTHIKEGKFKVSTGPGLGIDLDTKFMNSIIENGKW